MSDIKHILVPTDGSEGSLKAAGVAGDMARALGARVTVLLVQDERFVLSEAWNTASASASPQNLSGGVEEAREAMERKAATTELAATTKALGDVPEGAQGVQVWGHPADQICGYAKENGIDMIIMGSYGRSRLMRAMLGSVSRGVANAAPCAVTVVP
ncbi:MAG: universal stress protein [Pseudomonadota bacterium]